MSARDITDDELAAMRRLAKRLLQRIEEVERRRAGKSPPKVVQPEPPPEAFASVMARRARRAHRARRGK
jgi:hypothetical protein